MTFFGVFQIVLYLIVLILLARPVGAYIARVFAGESTPVDRFLRPLEKLVYRTAGVDPSSEMSWQVYALAMLVFNALGIAALYCLLRLQVVLPLNPQGFGAVAPDLAFNSAVSFVTNTNWQNYAGEASLSHLTQMLGMTVQNFLSAATGLAVLAAFIRGFSRHETHTLGNFWVDLTRSILYILLPLSFLVALLLVSQGTVQTFRAGESVQLLQTNADAEGQRLALGPAASQVAIKHLGTNGGGFYNANAAHPFENPTPLSDFILVLSETVLAAGLAVAFGKLVGDERQGWAILSVMLVLLAVFIFAAYAAEAAGNPVLTALGVDQKTSSLQPGGNMEGKEVRFGIQASALFTAATTATSSGAVNSMFDSYTPLGGLTPMVLIQLGEVVQGGVGSGLYGMLVFVIVAVFVAGLMVGRTPEYLGKKIEPFEMKMAALLILLMPVIVLGFTALAVTSEAGKAAVLNPGPHGFSEILYAYTSQGNNNGSAFAGLSGNNLYYNLTGSLAMLISRYWLAVPTLALAGSLGRKKIVPASSGTLPTHTPLFQAWLVGVIVMVGALNFIPALALGPVVEFLLLGK